jgi:hypothetical protein
LKLLADLGFDFHAVDDRNYSLLFHDIAFFGDNLTHLVREHSLDVNHIAKDELTPLTHAFKMTAEGHGNLEKRLEIMNVLIGFGAKVCEILLLLSAIVNIPLNRFRIPTK